jgi:hypothetical protein
MKNLYTEFIMKKFTFIISFALLFACTDTVFAQGWYNTGGTWLYRKAITVTSSTTLLPSSQSYFPLLVSFTDADLAARSTGSPSGQGNDILFTSDDGITKIPYEREKYTSGTGALVAWVQVPTLSVNRVIYMYYGNSSATDQQQRTGTWDANYKLIYHLGDAGPTYAYDATSNNNTGTQSGGVTFGATGQIDKATTYGANLRGISAGSAPGIGGTNSFTYEVWIYVKTYTNMTNMTSINGSYFLDRTTGTTPFVDLVPCGGKYGFYLRYDDATFPAGPNAGNIVVNTWQHVVMVRDYSNNLFRLYVNGTQTATIASTSGKALTPPAPKLGCHQSFPDQQRYLDGSLDEFRISNVARSADWIKAEYNNQSSPSTFYSVGAQLAYTTTTPDDKTVCFGSTSMNLTATVSPNPGGGTVQFYIDGNTVGSPAAVTAGIATLAYNPSALSAGSHAIRADFSGYGNFTSSSSNPGNNKTLTVNTTPTAPSSASATNLTICTGGSSTLSVTGGSGNILAWYSGSCGGTLVGTGNNLSVSPTTTTTYYARYESSPCTESNCVNVTVTVYQPSTAPTSISGTTTICIGGSTTLTAVGGNLGTGANYQWGTGSTVGTDPITGATSVSYSPSPTSNTTYWVRIENTSSPCTAATAGISQLVTVNTAPTSPTYASATNNTICTGGSSTLSVTGGSGNTLVWYSGSCGGTQVGTGNGLSVSPTTTTTYFARYESSPCAASSCVNVTVNVVADPSISGQPASPAAICSGGTTANMVITATGGTPSLAYQWQYYNGSSWGNVINDTPAGSTYTGGTASTFSVAGITAAGLYQYQCVVSAGGNGCGTATSNSVTVTVNPDASIVSVTGTTPLCMGETATYSANSVVLGGGSGAWSSDNTLVATVNSSTGVVMAIGSGTCNIIYTITGGCGGTKSAQQSLTVNATYGNPTVFGTNTWNVYAYNINSLDLTGTTYYGYYTESNLSFTTTDRWDQSLSPSSASGYQGCPVNADYFTFVSKRQGFPCGTYQIDVPSHDDGARLYVNGTLVWEHTGCCDAHPSVWTGPLNATSTVEFRVAEIGGAAYGALTFTVIPLAADFSVNNTLIATGGSVNFTDISTGGPTTWAWTFPGGSPSSSTAQNPTGIAYSAAGIYDVTLTATNACGSNAITKTNYITVGTSITIPFTSSNASWTVPCGVTSLSVECWGGGGAGGPATRDYASASAGGGAGGNYAKKANVVVTPSSTHAIVVGGIATASTTAIVNGTTSSFDATIVVATGGAGGLISSGATSTGGTSSVGASVGDAGSVFAGGSGGSGTSNSNSGGGGGGAGSSGAGNAATAGTAGVAKTEYGGAGGTGVNTQDTRNAGSPYGGGGSGGRRTSGNTTNYAGGNGAQGYVRITYIQAPPPTAYTVTGGGAYCSGGTGVAVGLSGSQTDVNYQLYLGASIVGSPVPGTGSALSFGNQTAIGTYTVVAKGATTLCTTTMTGSATVSVTPTVGIPTAITVSAGTEPTCQLTNGTTTTTYTTTATNSTGFNWSLSNGAAGTIGASTGIMTWSNGFYGSVNIQVTANGCNGPSAQVTRTVSIGQTVGTPTAITISAGTEPTCQLTNGTTTTTYTTTATNSTGFNWSLSNGAAGSIGATTGIMTWSNGFSGTVNIQVTANGCNGPSAQVTRTVNIGQTVGTPTAITVSAGTEPTCQLTNGTTTTTYSTTANNSTGFNWSLSNGAAGSIEATTGIMTWSDGFSGSVNIQVTANGCNGPSAQVTRMVIIGQTVGTPTAITVSAGTEPTCQLTNGTTTTTYSTTADNSTGFNWSISNGAAGSIEATTGIMTWSNGFSGSVTIQVTANGCNGPSVQVTRTITIGQTVGTPTAITVSAGTEPTCQLTNGTTTTTYSTTADNSTGFNWLLSNGAAGSIGATTGIMTWSNGFSGSVNIQVTANGCNGPSSQVIRTVNITPFPGAAGVITGVNTVTQGQTGVTYTVGTIANATSYVWAYTGTGATIIGSGKRITINFDGTATSGNVTVHGNNSCGDGASSSYAVTVLSGKTTAQSGSWNTASTWSPSGVPTASQSVTILHAVTIDITPTAVCLNLSINTGGSVTVNSGQALTVNGTLTNSVGTGALVLESSASLIDHNTYGNGAAATVKRSVPRDSKWHYISAPNAITTAGTFLNDFLIKWSEPGGAFTYITGINDPLEVGKGYGLWKNAITITPDPTIFTGALNTGNQSTGITNNAPSGTNKGMNLLGNPYPSYIDWGGLYSTYGAINYYSNGGYISWNNDLGAGSQYVPPMQGFFIYSANSSGTFSLNVTKRTHNTQAFYKSANTLKPNTVVLATMGESYSDKLFINFDPLATEGFDLQYDAFKILANNAGVSELYSYSSDKMLSIDVRPESDMIPLGFRNTLSGTYQLGIDQVADISVAVLEDTKVGIFHDMMTGPYSFDYTAGESDKRFILHFGTTGISDPEKAAVSIYSYQKTVYINLIDQAIGDVFVYNAAGQLLKTQKASRGMNEMKLPGTGVYMVKVVTAKSTTVKKVWISQ